MFIQINLKDDLASVDDAVQVARRIIDALDDANAIPDEITEISVGGYPDIWISDAANNEADALALWRKERNRH